MNSELPEGWVWLPFEKLLEIPLRNGIYKKKEFHGRGAKIVNMGELFGYPRLKDIDMKRVELTENELQKSSLQNGDLIFARRSLTAEGAGKCTIVLEVKEPTTFESSIIRARLDKEKANPEFYYYLFNSKFGKWLLGTILRQVAVAGITGSDLAKLEVPVPPLAVQEDIANHGALLDDKIELNRQTNQTLEQIAQAIFKSWFVDFEPVKAKIQAKQNGQDPERAAMCAISGKSLEELEQLNPETQQQLKTTAALFPDALVESELGEIPEGWEVKSLEKKMTPKKGKNITKKTITPGEVPVVAGGLTPAYYHNTHNVVAPVITISASGANAGYINLYHQNIWASDCSFLNKYEFNFIYSAYLFFKSRQDEITNMQQGAAQPHVYPKDLARLVLVDPPENIWLELEDIAQAFFEKIRINIDEETSLEKLRDSLLPKLLSGELKTGEAA